MTLYRSTRSHVFFEKGVDLKFYQKETPTQVFSFKICDAFFKKTSSDCV